jgi:hypothetical protein
VALSSPVKTKTKLDTTIIRCSDADACYTPCCRVPNLHRLQVIVIYSQPWTTLPGAPKNNGADEQDYTANEAPASMQFPVTAGLPWCVRLAATPTTLATPVNRKYDPGASVVKTGWNSKFNVPQAVYAKYGVALERARSFQFNFGDSCSRKGTGEILAYGQKGLVQASLSFTYRFPKPTSRKKHRRSHAPPTPPLPTCTPVPPELIRFEITGCTTKNAKFITLGNVNDFLPTCDDDECYDAVVVLGIQQWCCSCGPDQVPDASGDYAPHKCATTDLSCSALRMFGPC